MPIYDDHIQKKSMRIVSVLILGFILSFILCSSMLCHAQSTDQDVMSKARELVSSAKAAASRGEYQESIRLFEEANDLFSSADNIYAIASIYERIEGACSEALNAWDRFLSACQDCSLQERGSMRADKLRKDCTVELTIDSRPIGAQVTFDGEPRGLSPITLKAIAGRHKLTLKLKGYHPVQNTLFLLKGSKTEVKSIPLSPLTQLQPAPRETVPPVPTTTSQIEDQALSDQSSDSDLVSWSLIGAGALITGLGLWSYLSARAEVQEIDKAMTTEELNSRSTNSSYQLKEGLGYVGLGVGVGLSAFGVIRMTF